MVIWVMAPCSLVNGHQRLGGTRFLLYRDKRVRKSVKPKNVRSRVPPKPWYLHTKLDIVTSLNAVILVL
jgi:hypothetical protein